MKCAICGRKLNEKIKIRGGAVCTNCAGLFPESIRKGFRQFTAKQLMQARTLYTEQKIKPWLRCGEFGLGKYSIILNQFEYPLRKLRGIRLGFHPNAIGGSQHTVNGTVTLILETEKPYMVIEEPFLAYDITARYNINGLIIRYFFSPELSRMVQEVETAIKNGVYNLERFMEEYRSRQERQKEKEAQSKAREERRKSQQSRQKQDKKNEQPATPLEKARERFGLDMTYSTEDVKRARNRMLMKEKIHPDNGGSAEAFKVFEEEYRMLLKYAANAS